MRGEAGAALMRCPGCGRCGSGLGGEVGGAGEAAFLGELGRGGEEVLLAFEGLGGFDGAEFVGAFLAGGVPVCGDVCQGVGEVRFGREAEPGVGDGAIVGVGGDEEEEADRASRGDLMVREGAGDHRGIGEEEVAARLEDPGPLAEDAGAVGEVIDGVDAHDGVEGTVVEGEWALGVDDLEGGEGGQAATFGFVLARLDAIGVDVDADDGCTGLGGHAERGSA